ncbi:MAG TPA: PAS domain S-box protein, partial [Ignavibacteriaceae bacterium]|nr:PAS domain S-box protein [Ignavibacteriaceae bacterium]
MTSIKLKLNNYKSSVKNKQLIEVIDKIISSYPFSFVNLERLRKEVDSFDELFWIKNEEGKYLIVNKKFALSFHLSSSQIEGKPADKFLPSYLVDFNKAIDEYIKESRSVFIIEGFPLLGVTPGEDYQIIEIPIPGAENNLIALIGIAQKIDSREDEPENLISTLNLFKDFIKNYLVINNENIIQEISGEFCDNFSINKKDIKGKNYKELPVLLNSAIENFINSGEESKIINIPDLDKEYKLHFIKLADDKKLLLIDILNNIEETKNFSNHENPPYDFLINNNQEPSFIYDKDDLRFLQVNDAALKLYGYRKDEFLQMDLTDLYSPEDIQTLLDASEEKFKNGVYSKPQRQKRKDGSNIFVEINRTGIIYNNKEAYLNVVRNVFEKLNLQKESQHFKAAFNNTDNLIFITDKEGFIKEVNNAVKDELGYSSKSLQETSLTSLLIDDDRGKINSSVFQSDIKEKLTFDTFLKKAGSEYLKIKLTANPIFNYNKEVEYFNIVCITIKDKIKEIIKEVIKEVPVEIIREDKNLSSNINEEKFLSGIFHDLLTPINVILGFTQEFTENIDHPSSEQKEALEIIKQNRENLLSKMNQVMEFIQTENDSIEINPELIKVIDIIEDITKEIDEKNYLEDRELAFGKISSSLEIITDKNRMQKFLILLVKIISKITNEKKIYISASPHSEKYFTISLSDNYSETSEKFIEKLELIFSNDRKFIKDSAISSFTFKLCKNLLKLLNGKFEVNEEKEGREGSFNFPLKLEHDLLVKEKEEIHVSSETDIFSDEEIISNNNEKMEEIIEEEKE